MLFVKHASGPMHTLVVGDEESSCAAAVIATEITTAVVNKARWNANIVNDQLYE